MSKKKRRYGRNERDQVNRAQAASGQPTDQPHDVERAPVPERPEPKKFNAPLWAGLVVVIGLAVVLGLSFFGEENHLTIDSLEQPTVAALDGGSEVYPANSERAFTENTKFGYLPAPTLAKLGDGTIIAADPKTAPEDMGLEDDLSSLDRDSFLDETIKPPRKDTAPGEPITWDQMVDQMAGATVLMPLIESPEVAGPVLDKIAEADIADSTIVRTANAEVAEAASKFGVAAMYTGDPTASDEESLAAMGYSMIAVDAESAAKWTGTDLKVWATGVKDEAQLKELAEEGVFGALSTNPYTIQPSDVKTD
ncbi:hypothetical protein [Brevibacterium marinum]|uniref:Uncharacterized protein n=1 Tax=Brevibacterium marinum TaxID=418643 RepID=A0A846S6T1_9MICO|nr:hypothetical protein [Brevibacterium marinum]NJC58753.1 hypothetical protein [Brevibacterium marinum]